MRTSMTASKPLSQVLLAVVVGQGIRKLRGLGLHPLPSQSRGVEWGKQSRQS